MKAILPILAFCALAASSAAPVFADSGSDTSAVGNFSFRLGVICPESSSARNASGYTPISLGTDFTIAQAETAPLTMTSYYIDYWGGASHGQHMNTVGLGICERAYQNSDSSDQSANAQFFYYGAGAGAYYLDNPDRTKTTLGLKVLGGLSFGESTFVELSYNLIIGSGSYDPSGLMLQIGLRK